LVVGEANPAGSDLLSKNGILLDEVFNGMLLVLV
jgi:hypothetical protein